GEDVGALVNSAVDGQNMVTIPEQQSLKITNDSYSYPDAAGSSIPGDVSGSPIPPKTPRYLHGKEKTYICPVPLCVKAYLNPGGLRYHASKGTCVMADGNPCPPVSPSDADTDADTANKRANALLHRRRSGRLASSSSSASSVSTAGKETRGSVKARSKSKTKLKTTPRQAQVQATSSALFPFPSSCASSPWSSYSPPDLDFDFDSDTHDSPSRF
ncbi:hypothetical protein B0H12DRAFT_1156179, partial [Mycena haematopus]